MQMKNIIATVIAIGFVITGITITSSCKREYDTVADYDMPAGIAYLRIVHAAPYFRNIFNAPDSFNVLVGGQKVTGYLPGGAVVLTYNTTYPTSSSNYGYFTVPAGEQEIKLSLGSTNPDSVTLKKFTKVLAPDNYYTFMITDSINSARDIAQIFVRDSLTSPTIGYFSLRFIHAALRDTATTSQKTVDTIDVFSTRNNRNIYNRITPGTVTTFSQYAYNSQLSDTLYVRRTRSTVNLATFNSASFGNQRTYTLYFKGDGNATTGTRARSLGSFIHR
jgi:hypothetical protein